MTILRFLKTHVNGDVGLVRIKNIKKSCWHFSFFVSHLLLFNKSRHVNFDIRYRKEFG
eukprot:UN10925